MSRRRPLQPNSVWDTEAVLHAFESAGIKPHLAIFHAHRLWSLLIRFPTATWNDLPDLPKAAKQLLDQGFTKFTTRVLRCVTSSDGETTKLLVALQDGQQVEAVIMHYDTRAVYEDPSADAGDATTTGTQPPAEPHTTNGGPASHELGDDDFHSCDGHSDSGERAETGGDAAGGVGAEAGGEGAEAGGDGAGGDGADVAVTPAAGTTPTAQGNGSEAAQPSGPQNIAQENGNSSASGLDSDLARVSLGGASVSSGRTAGSARPGRAGWERTLGGRRGGRSGAGGDGGVVVRGARRSTLCVSSQVGCQMGCTFCATGTMGLKGHLTSGEIVEQLVHANAVTRVRNIVFMGMGEPLHNYEPVRNAIRLMTDSRTFQISLRHVTLSTVGVVPRIKQLAADLPGISLALSLHAPTQALRATIVPSARAYPLDKLMAAVRQYEVDSRQRVFMEYVMLAGVNDGAAEAHALGALLSGHAAILNLIPWNPVIASASSEGKAPAPMAFKAPSMDSVLAFQSIVKEQYGIPTTVRQEKGQDIGGACGQLVIQQQDMGISHPPADRTAPVQGSLPPAQRGVQGSEQQESEVCCGQSGGCGGGGGAGVVKAGAGGKAAQQQQGSGRASGRVDGGGAREPRDIEELGT